jgi:hypothetical protein
MSLCRSHSEQQYVENLHFDQRKPDDTTMFPSARLIYAYRRVFETLWQMALEIWGILVWADINL